MTSPSGARPADLPPIERLGRAGWFLGWLVALAGWLVLMRIDVDAVLGAPSDDGALETLRTVGVLAVPAVLLILVVHAYWRLRLEILAFRPGPLVLYPVRDYRGPAAPVDTASGSTIDTWTAKDVGSALQKRLVETRLYGPTAIPSPGRERDFVEVVEETGSRVEGIASIFLRLPRILGPRSSYEVDCSIHRRETDVELLVELTRLPNHALAPQKFVGFTWDDVTEDAANWICSVVLPRTRQCRVAPWPMWQGLHLDPSLFAGYRRFQKDLGDILAEDSLKDLDYLLSVDPLNLALRLERGKLLEQTGRFLEALETYDALLALAARSDRRLAYLRFGPPPINRGDPDPDANRRWSDARRVRGLPRTDSTVFVARYRFALLLGLDEQLADQWWPAHASDDRFADVRRSLANRMRTAYQIPVDRMKKQFHDLVGDVALNVDEFLDVDVHNPDLLAFERARRQAGARLFFTTIGMWEVEHLVSELPSRALFRWPYEELVPRRSIELLVPRAALRRALAIRAASAMNKYVKKATDSILFPIDECVYAPGLAGLMKNGWPPDAVLLENWIRARFGRRGGVRSWHEHYNAACVIAILLLTTREKVSRDRIAGAAVAELERAVACGDAGFLGARGSWIVSKDPDLSELRTTEAFQDFRITSLVRRQSARPPGA